MQTLLKIPALFAVQMFFFMSMASAQKQNVQHEILNYQNATSDVILKGRRMLLDNFIAGNIDKVKEIKDYLEKEVQDEINPAFYIDEIWLLLFWTQEYRPLIQSIMEYNTSDNSTAWENKNKPLSLQLFDIVREKTRSSKALFELEILNSDLNSVDKDFLVLFLNYIISGDDYPEITQSDLNAVADLFLDAHPHSEYDEYVRINIRYKMVVSKWGYGFEFFSGFGFFTNALGDIYKNNVPFGVAFDVCFKDYTLYLRDYIGFGTTKMDLYYATGVWEKGSNFNVFLPELSLGYAVWEDKNWKISPFAGISSTDIGPTSVDIEAVPGLDQAAMTFTTTYTLGINFDWKMASTGVYGAEAGYWYFRLRYALNMPQFAKHYPGMEGNMHYITLGIGGMGRKVKRDL